MFDNYSFIQIVLLKLNLQGHSKKSQLHSIHFFLEEVDINGADDIGKKKHERSKTIQTFIHGYNL